MLVGAGKCRSYIFDNFCHSTDHKARAALKNSH